MTSLTCVRVSSLIASRKAGLSEADKLRVEQHVATCDACARAANTLDMLGQIYAQSAHVADVAHQRVLVQQALLNTSSRAASAEAKPLITRWAPFMVASAAAFAAVLVLWLRHAPTLAERNDGSVLTGSVAVNGHTLTSTHAVPKDTELNVRAGARLSLGHAVVAAEPNTRLRWNPDTETVSLISGAVRVQVDKGPHKRYAVTTRQFTVEVTGTGFRVTNEEVRVWEGRVRVRDASGAVLNEALTAGQTYRVGDERVIAAITLAPAPTPEIAGGALTPAVRARQTLTVPQQLVIARAALAKGDTARAESAVRLALASKPSARQQAEAETLQAECALVAGNREAAAKRYLAVANRFAATAEGDNALFAAARLRAELSDTRNAAALFERYLTEYPRGKFRNQAKSRIVSLSR